MKRPPFAMKSSSLSAWVGVFVLAWEPTGQCQASFELRNLHTTAGVDAPVTDGEGIPLAGARYRAELWGGSSQDSLAPAVLVLDGNRREMAPFTAQGYVVSPVSSLSILDVPAFGWAWLQLRAWDTTVGASYEEALERGLGGYGESPLFHAQGRSGFDPIPAPLLGLQPFSLRPVIPERGPVALLSLGGALVWFTFRRSKSTSREPLPQSREPQH